MCCRLQRDLKADLHVASFHIEQQEAFGPAYIAALEREAGECCIVSRVNILPTLLEVSSVVPRHSQRIERV